MATEVSKPPVTVENDDDGPRPADALAAAREMLDDKEYDKALKLANIAVKRMPKRSGAWNTLGRVQLQMGKRKDAIASFEKAVDLNPKNSYARNNLGLALIYDKRFEEAADMLEQAVELEPVEAYMWNNLGMAYEQLDRLEDARVGLRQRGRDGQRPGAREPGPPGGRQVGDPHRQGRHREQGWNARADRDDPRVTPSGPLAPRSGGVGRG